MRKAIALLMLTALISCNDEVTGLEPPSDPTTETFAASLGVNIATMTKTALGVWYSDVTVGAGIADTATTDSIKVTYLGRLKDGKQFDAAANVVFQSDKVLVGMRSGLLGMKEGGKRKLVIPSALAYGFRAFRDTAGAVSIPRQSTLVFDVDLLKVFNHVDTTKTSLRAP